MLIQFTVENHLSFRDKAVLSLRAPAGASEHDSPACIRVGDEVLLRATVFYGANASGKSNLVRALQYAIKLILDGTTGKRGIARHPFKLTTEARRAPSQFELSFLHKAEGEDAYTQFHYGFAIDDERVFGEWLYRGPESTEELLFERSWSEQDEAHEFVLGDFIQDPKQRQFYEFLHQGTRVNQLFLSEAESKNAPAFDAPLSWLRKQVVIIAPDAKFQQLVAHVHGDEDFRIALTGLMSRADTGIRRLHTVSQALPDLPDEIKDMVNRLAAHNEVLFEEGGAGMVLAAAGGYEHISLRTQRARDDGSAVDFTLDEESDGTLRFMHLAPILCPWTDEPGLVHIADELERSLHPLLTREFMRMFIDAGDELPHQLLCTTHDTNLLDCGMLEPASIWFVERDAHGGSHIYSLHDFDADQIQALRADDKLESGYLQGRFGAIPFLGDKRRLVASKLADELLRSARHVTPGA